MLKLSKCCEVSLVVWLYLELVHNEYECLSRDLITTNVKRNERFGLFDSLCYYQGDLFFIEAKAADV